MFRASAPPISFSGTRWTCTHHPDALNPTRDDRPPSLCGYRTYGHRSFFFSVFLSQLPTFKSSLQEPHLIASAIVSAINSSLCNVMLFSSHSVAFFEKRKLCAYIHRVFFFSGSYQEDIDLISAPFLHNYFGISADRIAFSEERKPCASLTRVFFFSGSEV